MKPTIHKRKDPRGRRVLGYDASGYGVDAEGATPADARTAWETAVADACTRLARGTTVAQFRGHTFVVFPTLYGFGYWLDTFSSGYSIHTAGTTKEDATDRALHHLAQSVWDATLDDDEFLASIPVASVRSELAGWVRWQRGYADARARGLDDEACRAHASAVQYGRVA